MPSPTEITAQQLARLIGTPACPLLVDICIDEDFEDDPRFIPGAWRWPFTRIEELVPQLIGHKVVVICQKGKKLSQGAAALLRLHAIDAQNLEGGNYAWRDAGLPLVPAKIIPERDEMGRTLWVTRLRPKIDRIACPWLIRRFVDPFARFIFVSPDEVGEVAEKFKATPFDIEGVFWSHRAKGCTFDTMVEEFALDFPALKTLSQIVRAADTDHLADNPQAPGLLAASLGLSRMHNDDLAQLEQGMGLYDMFYRWARDAKDESHNWQGESCKKK